MSALPTEDGPAVDYCPKPTRAVPGSMLEVVDRESGAKMGATVRCQRCGRRVKATKSGRPRVHATHV